MSLQQLQALLQQQQDGAGGDGGALVKFKAGKLNLSGTTVKADPRKGQVSLVMVDGILHFRWEVRLTGEQENDWMLFAGSATWEKVPECKDARVFLLRMAHTNVKHFFWMQEPKDDKDEEYFKTINENLSNPGQTSEGGTSSGGVGGASGSGAFGAADFGMGGNDQAAIMAMIQAQQHQAQQQSQSQSASQSASQSPSSSSPTSVVAADSSSSPAAASTTASSAATTSQQPHAQQPLLNEATARSLAAALAGAANNSSSSQNQSPEATFLAANENSLADLLDAEAVLAVLGDQSELMEQLMPHLPEGERTPELLRENLRSPQLRQTLNRIQNVLNSGEMAGLLQQLGLPQVNNIGAEAFLQAIQQYVKEKKAEKDSHNNSNDQQDDDGDVDMDKSAD